MKTAADAGGLVLLLSSLVEKKFVFVIVGPHLHITMFIISGFCVRKLYNIIHKLQAICILCREN